jgi:hypothetical protein
MGFPSREGRRVLMNSAWSTNTPLQPHFPSHPSQEGNFLYLFQYVAVVAVAGY